MLQRRWIRWLKVEHGKFTMLAPIVVPAFFWANKSSECIMSALEKGQVATMTELAAATALYVRVLGVRFGLFE